MIQPYSRESVRGSVPGVCEHSLTWLLWSSEAHAHTFTQSQSCAAYAQQLLLVHDASTAHHMMLAQGRHLNDGLAT